MADWSLAPVAQEDDRFAAAPVLGGTPATGRRAQDITDAIIAGLQNSATGLALRGKLPTMQLGEDAPWYQRLAANAAGVVADVPEMIAGGFAGAPAGPIGAGAGAFAAPMALREGLIAAYNNNHALSWSGVWDIAKASIKGGVKGAVIGGVTTGAGGLAARAIGPAIAGEIGTSLTVQGGMRAISATQTAAELAAMTTTASALDGRLPTWQDFMDNALMLGGMKAATHIATGMREIYAQTGKTPEQVRTDAAKNPEIALDLKPVEKPIAGESVVTVHHGSPYEFETFDASKVGTGEGTHAYGHGLYFAENPLVASEYARTRGLSLTQAQLDAYYKPGNKVIPYGATEAIDKVIAYDKSTGRVTVERTEDGKTTTVTYGDTGADKAKVLQALGGDSKNVYKVQIPKRVVDDMLDWDKPLNEQTPDVQKAFAAAIAKRGLPPDAEIADVRHVIKSDPGFTQILEEAGITGVKYLDALSREKGEGTRNYVLFNAEHARVVERNGIAIPRAYTPLALEERVKAAVDADPRPEAIRELFSNPEKPVVLGEPPAANPVRAEYIVDADTHKAVLRVLTEQYRPEIEAQRRGVVSNTQTLNEMKDILVGGGPSPHKVGAAENAPEMAARLLVLRAASHDAWTQMQKLAKTPTAELTPVDKLQALAAIERLAAVKAEADGALAEWGRAGQIVGRLKRDPSLLGDAETLLKLAERKGDLQDIATLAMSMKDPAQLARFASDYTKATTLEKVLEAWKAGILTGPQTHLANIFGNAMKWVVEIPESTISATLFAIDRAAKGDPLTLAQWKARAFQPLYGLQMGAAEALHAAAEVWRGQGEHVEKADIYRGAIEGQKGKIIRLPFKALQFEDVLFRTIAERGEAYKLAVDRVVKEGFHPDSAEWRERVQQYTDQPAFGLQAAQGEAIMKQIQQAGAESVFSQRLGPRMEMMQRALAGHWAQFVVPFIRTPANLVSWAVQHVPGLNFISGRWREDWSAGGERQARATARVVIGTGLAVTAYALAKDGTLTGGGLFAPEERRTKEAAGWQPYSFKVGDKYYSYQRIEPVAKVLGIAADLIDLSQHADDMDKAKIAAMTVLMFGNATVSTTYLSGLANVIQGLTDPERYGPKLLDQYATSLVPKAIGQTAAAMDPNKRQIDGVLDAIQSQIPFLREKMLPKRDVWGEPTKNDKWFDVMPVQTSEASHDKVRNEAMRLHLAIADAPKFLLEKGPFNPSEKRIELQPEQRDVFREVSGKNAMTILAPIVNSPDWNQIPDFAKAEVFKKVIEGTRKQGQYAALPPDDAARAKLREQIVEKIIKQTQAVESK